MKIRKFYDFINEELNDTPETYINSLLTKLKRDVDRMFNYESILIITRTYSVCYI